MQRSVPLLFRPTLATQMKVCVGVKRVVDYTVKIRVKDNRVQTDNVKMSVNPFDEIAIEEAVRLKEKKVATEVVAVTIGPKKSEDSLRTALALGCDKAVHVVCTDAEAAALEPLGVAKIMAKLNEDLKPDMWLLGKQAIDGDYGVTPQLLAGLLDVPQGTYASAVEVKDGKAKVTREIDAGRQVVEINLPCVLAADLRLNTPRFAALPKIMQARKKPIDARKLESLGVDVKPRLTTVSVAEPETRKAGVKVADVTELVSKLKSEAKAL